MRTAVFLILLPGPLAAHPGHLVEAAGHSHWVAGAAVAVAIGLGLWTALGRRRPAAQPAEPEAEGAADSDEAKA